MEYRITTSEIPAQCEDAENHTGLLVYIRPPVPLHPEAVERYLATGAFEPLTPNRRHDRNNDINDVILLGSTAEQTTIYVSMANPTDGLPEQVTEDVAQLLRFMGATAIIDHPPAPEA